MGPIIHQAGRSTADHAFSWNKGEKKAAAWRGVKIRGPLPLGDVS